MNYYYTDANNQTQGPAPLDDIRRKQANGEIPPNAMVIPVGGQSWVPLSSVSQNAPSQGPADAPPSYSPASATPGMRYPHEVAQGSESPPSGAIWALVLGILSMVMCSIFAGIPAIIVGNSTRRNLKAIGSRNGDGMALAGIILGWVSVGFIVLYLLFFILFAGVASSGGFMYH